MQEQTLPLTGYIRLESIIGNRSKNIPPIIPVGRTTWLMGVKNGDYPKPIKLSPRTVAWRVSDIIKLIEELESE